MGTPALIAMKNSGKSTRVNYDGDTFTVGAMLCNQYANPSDARCLTDDRDLISLVAPEELKDADKSAEPSPTMTWATPDDLEQAARSVGAEYVYIGQVRGGEVLWLVAHRLTQWNLVPLGEMTLLETRRIGEVNEDLAREAMYTLQSCRFDSPGPTSFLAHRAHPSPKLLNECLEELESMERAGKLTMQDLAVRGLVNAISALADFRRNGAAALRATVGDDLAPLVEVLVSEGGMQLGRDVRLGCVPAILAYASTEGRVALAEYLKNSDL